jgi:hypothetical protein
MRLWAESPQATPTASRVRHVFQGDQAIVSQQLTAPIMVREMEFVALELSASVTTTRGSGLPEGGPNVLALVRGGIACLLQGLL